MSKYRYLSLFKKNPINISKSIKSIKSLFLSICFLLTIIIIIIIEVKYILMYHNDF